MNISETLRLRLVDSRVSWVLADQVLVSGGNFVLGVLIARLLGIEAYGSYVILWIAATALFTLQQNLIIQPMMSFGPKRTNNENQSYFAVLTLQQILFAFFGSLLVAFVVWLFSDYFNIENNGRSILPFFLSLFFWLLQDFVRRYFFTQDQPLKAFVSDFISYSGKIVVLLVLANQIQLDLPGVFWITAITSMLGVLPGMSIIQGIRSNANEFSITLRKHWGLGKWLAGAGMCQMAVSEGPFMIAGALLGPQVVGGLRATWNVLAMIHILFQGMDNLIPVQGARIYATKGISAMLNYLKGFTIIGVSITAFVMLVVIVMPEFWVKLFYGEQFIQYAYMTRIQAFIFILIFLTHPLMYCMRILEVTRPEMRVYLMASVLSIVMVIPMTMRWGEVGGMIAYGLVDAIVVYLLWRALQQVLANVRNRQNGH